MGRTGLIRYKLEHVLLGYMGVLPISRMHDHMLTTSTSGSSCPWWSTYKTKSQKDPSDLDLLSPTRTSFLRPYEQSHTHLEEVGKNSASEDVASGQTALLADCVSGSSVDCQLSVIRKTCLI